MTFNIERKIAKKNEQPVAAENQQKIRKREEMIRGVVGILEEEIGKLREEAKSEKAKFERWRHLCKIKRRFEGGEWNADVVCTIDEILGEKGKQFKKTGELWIEQMEERGVSKEEIAEILGKKEGETEKLEK